MPTDLARRARVSALTMCSRSGASHIGAALSVIDILSVLYGEVADVAPHRTEDPARDIVLVSKGHSASGVYAVMAHAGFFPVEWLDDYYLDGSRLGGHVTAHGIPGVELSTGALGHALPFGVGRAITDQLDGIDRRVFVVLSDGECAEGSNWEAALMAAHRDLRNMTVIIDRNRLQILGRTEDVLGLEPFVDKWRAFGWEVVEVDGHDHDALAEAMRTRSERPRAIVANTIKGKGVDFMEDTVEWHTLVPNEEQLAIALAQLEVTEV
ncbi:MAG: transketolase [Candidatus Nanopelagicales bacterium]|nr:transketolase [Candidatus Nanopelagicales bacterium]MCF8537700.1 transketolase [Candidatus Nanopelagicales bacterium]MCF8542315.1 transketolase [Candidatus Nanopelagicales bacterium]MCF8557157.1 transketolase [Candidatus Nanopelagicales bacterium]